MTGVLEKQAAMSGPAWLQQLRERGNERFAEVGFPTTHQEEWRFTNVVPLTRIDFQRAEHYRLRSLDLPAPRLVFMNGRLDPDLSVLPKGVLAGRLLDFPEIAEEHLGRYASIEQNPFVALNTAFLEDGALISVGKGVIIEDPIRLVFMANNGFSHPRVLIVAGEAAQCTFIESYQGVGKYFTNAVTEITAGDNAVVDHYKLQSEDVQAFHIATMQVHAGRGANFSSHSISLGGALVRNDVNAVLSEGTEATLNGLYMVRGRQHVDNHTAIDHAMPHGTSHELYKGILDGYATAVFNGKIFVRKDAQKTDAKQTNKNLVLSEDSVINTKPELQIHADDVRCTHGATIGQLDADAIFYLRSRGIGRDEARHLLTYAFARDIVDRIRVASLRESLEHVLYKRLHEHRN